MRSASASSRCAVRRRERGGVRAGDLDSREALAERERQRHERAGVAAAEEVDRRAGARGARAVSRHQLGAVHARRLRVPERVQRPHERLSVGHDERHREHGPADLLVLAREHHEVDGCCADARARARATVASIQSSTRAVVAERERDAQHLRAGGRGAAAGRQPVPRTGPTGSWASPGWAAARLRYALKREDGEPALALELDAAGAQHDARAAVGGGAHHPLDRFELGRRIDAVGQAHDQQDAVSVGQGVRAAARLTEDRGVDRVERACRDRPDLADVTVRGP